MNILRIKKVDYILLLILSFLAMIFDIRSCKIPNKLIIAGYATGIINLCIRHGPAGIFIGLCSIAIVWLIISPVYMLRGLGGGDCKLLAWIPLFTAPELILEQYFYIFVCAATMGVLKLLVHKKRQFRFAIAAFAGVLWSVLKYM